MINEKLLKLIWNKYHFTYETNCVFIGNKKLNIFICNDYYYKYILKIRRHDYNKRKNCLISRQLGDKRNLIIHENYIHSIIRQKLLNKLLND